MSINNHFNLKDSQLIQVLAKSTVSMTQPMSCDIIKLYGKDPFLILISCLLSLRSRDAFTLKVCKELFKVAQTPQEILDLDQYSLEQILFSIGFYKRKAQILKEVSMELIERFAGFVPNTYEQLVSINHIGPKTANLVLGYGFDIPAICVDVHVHRIANRLGISETKTPEETEKKLKEILPINQWININRLLVIWGQNICVPVSPKCSECPLFNLCKKRNVTKYR